MANAKVSWWHEPPCNAGWYGKRRQWQWCCTSHSWSAKQIGVLTVGTVTAPFSFWWHWRSIQASSLPSEIMGTHCSQFQTNKLIIAVALSTDSLWQGLQGTSDIIMVSAIQKKLVEINWKLKKSSFQHWDVWTPSHCYSTPGIAKAVNAVLLWHRCQA